jgi:hypothetical protein
MATSGSPGAAPLAFTLSQHGGTVTLDGAPATVSYDDVRRLVPGTEIVALLRRDGDRYVVAGHYGLFTIRSSRVAAAYPVEGELRKFDGMDADTVIAELVALSRARQP